MMMAPSGTQLSRLPHSFELIPVGTERYSFKHPRFIHIRRLRRSDFIDEHIKLWQFMIDHGPMLQKKYCIAHGIPLQQLVLGAP